MKFENAFLRRKGEAFEKLFADIMGDTFPDDFQAADRHGSIGDIKYDGCRAGDKTVFRFHAPKSPNPPGYPSRWFKKIDNGFAEVREGWRKRMERRAPVHGARDGPPARVVGRSADPGVANPIVHVGWFGHPKVFNVVIRLSGGHLEDPSDPNPNRRILTEADFKVLHPIMVHIRKQIQDEVEPGRTAPSPSKLKANAPSVATVHPLPIARPRGRPVEQFFSTRSQPGLVKEIVQEFRERHKAPVLERLSPDGISGKLSGARRWIDRPAPRQAAARAVMSQFFERRGIFEGRVEEDNES